MKKITQEELEKIDFTKTGRKGSNPVLNELRKLEVGEMILVKNEDWKPKSEPSVIVYGSFRDGKKFSVRKLGDDSGWVMKRRA